MLKRRLNAIIVANHAGARVRRFSVPYSFLAVIGVCALIGVLALGGAVFQYGRMLVRVVDYEDRLLENDTLRYENREYKVQTAQLSEKIDFLETLAHRLSVFSGMTSDKSVGGVGGMSKDILARPRSVASGTLASIPAYDEKLDSLESTFRTIDNRITDQVLVEASSPNILPVNGYITAGWGPRPNPFDPSVVEMHPGVDISAPLGIKVVAPADGIVIFAGPRAGYGNMVVIDHKFGTTTRYGHLQRIVVQIGQRVSRNEIIGHVGASGRTTGPHLHYEIWQFNRNINPIKFLQSVKSKRALGS
jgi:murein DD-endopeptidase MepM/ murein hydrolase activator NlpD